MSTKCIASANRIETVLHAPIELEPEDGGLPLPTSDHIVFENVSFSYNGEQNDLEDISFSLPHGGTLGIIGATGSGKTTLTALLMRFYDVTSGAIRIDGRDVRTIPEDELHSMFGVAMQHDFIVADTIKENIYVVGIEIEFLFNGQKDFDGLINKFMRNQNLLQTKK